ncbi:DUF397 domain-containing protein [Rhizomonospora bruguierae]|uniref:DUF397 domain-containing protein n=1 Tax=Rhizomonospora bruguierae TaxID=1581705 RepID=UPI001BCBBCD6|nr:DUF397 domain-containing protein [Micromonospora sp. NBRC 107566]
MADGDGDLVWRRARACESHACVEVAVTPQGVRVRNSREPAAVLAVNAVQWRRFCDAVAAGEFRLPA